MGKFAAILGIIVTLGDRLYVRKKNCPECGCAPVWGETSEGEVYLHCPIDKIRGPAVKKVGAGIVSRRMAKRAWNEEVK